MRKCITHLILALLSLVLMWGQQTIFYQITPHQPPQMTVEKWGILFFFLLLGTLIKSRFWRLSMLAFIPTLNLAQMLHLQYMGSRIFPAEIGLLVLQIREIWGAIGGEAHHNIWVVVLGLVPMGVIFLADKFLKEKQHIPFLHFLFILYFLYNPIRTYSTGNTWGRQPSIKEPDGLNVYLSFSYYLGRILPLQLSGSVVMDQLSGPDLSKKFTQKLPVDFDVIFVMGESQSPWQMSLYKDELKTTPFLASLKSDPNFVYRLGFSSAVSSDVSLALLFNNTYGVGSSSRISKGDSCLFDYAKRGNFKTFYYSTQSKHHLRYIINTLCPHRMDEQKIWENLAEAKGTDEDASDDLWLLNYLPKRNEKSFVVLHQRGAHAPYHKRYLAEDKIYPIVGSVQAQRLAHYRNAVFRFDRFFKLLIEKVKNENRPTLILYVSDHGEGFGEEGAYGHATLKKVAAEVPIFFYAHQMDDFLPKLKSLPENPTHLTISLLLSNLFGFENETSWMKAPESYTVLGNDMDGFAGGMILNFVQGKMTKLKVEKF